MVDFCWRAVLEKIRMELIGFHLRAVRVFRG